MNRYSLCVLALLALVYLPGCSGAGGDTGEVVLDVEHKVVTHLGAEHIGNMAWRRTDDGPRFIAWGSRVLQWPIEPSAPTTEVVPPEEGLKFTNGGTVMDVDGDGVDEFVVGKHIDRSGPWTRMLWFDDTEGQTQWQVHQLAKLEHGNWDMPHDIQPITLNAADGSEMRGVVVTIGRGHLVWFEIPEDPTEPWIRHEIAELPAPEQSGMEIHDVNGDGQNDVVSGMYWAEGPANPSDGEWTVHRFGWDEPDYRWEGMAEHAIADMNGDGTLDMVVTEAEIPGARVGIFSPGENVTQPWNYTSIDTSVYCPHSLIVTDVTEDGRPDVIVGEMTMGGWDFPLNRTPTMHLYVNQGNMRFTHRVLDDGWGVHEMSLAPEKRNGKVMLFAADEIQKQKRENMNTHISYWLVDAVPVASR